MAVVLQATLIPIALLAVVLLLFVLWGLWYHSRSKAIAVFEPEAVSLAYQRVYPSWKKRGAHEKEFSPGQLQLVRELGEGAFGVVFQAEADGIVEDSVSTVVAVKQLRSGSGETMQAEEFFREVDFMSKLDHPNIVRLLGVCSLEEPFSMIFEYMDLGDLCSFLRDAAGLGEGEDETLHLLTNQELICIAQQVVDGMVYISSQHLVHRDLATRNCLVATGLVVKIADFGMSRDVHSSDYYRSVALHKRPSKVLICSWSIVISLTCFLHAEYKAVPCCQCVGCHRSPFFMADLPHNLMYGRLGCYCGNCSRLDSSRILVSPMKK